MAWIAGERVILRAWERDDVRAYWETSQTADALGQRLRDRHQAPESLHQMELEFDGWANEPDATVVRLIIEAAGRAVGDIDLFHIDQRNRNALIGVGIWRADDRNKGYGSDAVRAMVRWGFRQLNLHRIELSVEPENAAAMHVYEKIGFVSEGRRREDHYDDGCYRDEEIMGILRREFEAREHAST
jgi:RimJ/RimL family protein N-acetyltransferase